MARVQGREITRPILNQFYLADAIQFRIDDGANHEFWLTVEFTPEEWVEITNRYFTLLAERFGIERVRKCGVVVSI